MKMALYDNQHWLLSHIRDSFLSTDDTGKCEMVMLGEDIPKQLRTNGTLRPYPGMEESDGDDVDVLPGSADIKMDMKFNPRDRFNAVPSARSQGLKDLERKKIAKVNVKWEHNPSNISLAEQTELFQRKNFRKTAPKERKQSLLSEQLGKCPNLPRNPFIEYSKFDGDAPLPFSPAQVDIPIRKYKIFMCLLPEEHRMYPLHVAVITTAKVSEFIGLICYKYTNEHPDNPLKEDISRYALRHTEKNGEVDWDFSCLDPGDPISKFHFPTLGLVEVEGGSRPEYSRFNKEEEHLRILEEHHDCKDEEGEGKEVANDLAKMEGHTTAMEAPLYQSYRVYIINKMRAKTEIYLGISGEKIEINPVITGKGGVRFWNRQRAVSYQIDNIAWCQMTEIKGSKAAFTLVYTPHSSISDSASISSGHSPSIHQSPSFKNHEFEADSIIAEEIVRKINHILELHSSTSRKDYLSQKERKSSKRKSFHLHGLLSQ